METEHGRKKAQDYLAKLLGMETRMMLDPQLVSEQFEDVEPSEDYVICLDCNWGDYLANCETDTETEDLDGYPIACYQIAQCGECGTWNTEPSYSEEQADKWNQWVDQNGHGRKYPRNGICHSCKRLHCGWRFRGTDPNACTPSK